MPARKRVVGWLSESEWESVYYNIFHGDREQIRAGLDVIALWRARFVGRIPVAIEATSQLLESNLLEGHEHSLPKRQSMATAISQFVGLLTERSLRSQLHAPPMIVRAEMLGIPEWLTSLRHDAAHGFVPSYEMLHKGIEFALNWLKVHHWQEHLKKQKDEAEVTTKNDEMEKKVVELFRDYINFNSKKSKGCQMMLNRIESFISRRPEASKMLCNALIHHNFIPIQKSDANKKYYVGHNGDRLELSEWTVARFGKIFHLLKETQQLDFLLVSLCDELNYPYTSVESATLWIDFLLEISRGSTFSSTVWYKIIFSMVNAKMNNHVIQKALDIAELPGGVKYDPNYRNELLARLQNGISSEDLPITNTHGIRGKVDSWTLSPLDLKDCPLGVMPGQTREALWRDLVGEKLKEPHELIPHLSAESDLISNCVNAKTLCTGNELYCHDFDLL